VIPLRDVIPSRTFPFITITIIVINALAWSLSELHEPRQRVDDDDGDRDEGNGSRRDYIPQWDHDDKLQLTSCN